MPPARRGTEKNPTAAPQSINPTFMKKSLRNLAISILSITTTIFATATGFADDTTLGFIYVGPKDDYGYNQAHAEGAAGVAKLRASK